LWRRRSGTGWRRLDKPPEEAVAVLRGALEDEEPLVREHAAWALQQVRNTKLRGCQRTGPLLPNLAA
jgi:hypothetical protein